MYVTRLRIEGLRDAPEELGDLSRVASLPSGLARCAVADALALLSAALDPAQLPGLDTLGWGAFAIPSEPDHPVEGLDPVEVGSALSEGTENVTVEAELHVGPPVVGQLRRHALRDPRMVTALGQRPALSLKVGWLFSVDRTIASPSVLGLRVGEVAFETLGKDRPVWLPRLLVDLAGRFARTTPLESVASVTQRALDASLSPDPRIRACWQRLASSLQSPPFSLPEPLIVQQAGRSQLVFGPRLSRIRQIGRGALDHLRLLEAALVGRPDVLVIDESLSPAVARWFAQLPEGAQAPIEQIWISEGSDEEGG